MRRRDSRLRPAAGSAALLAAALSAAPAAWSCAAAPSAAGAAAASAPAPEAARSLTAIAGERRVRAGFLLVDGVYNTELTAPYDVFQHTLHHAPDGLGIEVFTVSPDGGAVETAEGLTIAPHYGFDDAPPIDLLVVPSAAGSRDRDLADRRLISWVTRVADDAAMVMSLCWGAFVLAESGQLEGRQATTFPRDYAAFSRRFPGVDLRVNVSFVHDGKALTSQGGARSFEAAMYLVDRLYGEAVARGVGGGLLVSWPPDPESGPGFVSAPAARPAGRR